MLQLNGNLKIDDHRIELRVPVVFFKDENQTDIIYCPSLELSAYGNSLEDAKKMFHITVEEFFKYLIHKKTMSKALKELGWKMKKKSFIPPLNTELISRNEDYHDILNHVQHTHAIEDITI